jgi:hypothetical protein
MVINSYNILPISGAVEWAARILPWFELAAGHSADRRRWIALDRPDRSAILLVFIGAMTRAYMNGPGDHVRLLRKQRESWGL